MAIFDLYSKRQKRDLNKKVDVFIYDEIPRPLRIQIVHIWRDVLANRGYAIFKLAHEILSKEYGLFSLVSAESQNSLSNLLNPRSTNYEDILKDFFLDCNNNDRVLDVIEIIFGFIVYVANDVPPRDAIPYKEAIDELNLRFIEHGIGYQFESGQIIRKDSELFHQEAVKPVLNFLSSTEYIGANEEFLKAHEHYRHRRYKECLNECLKSFESVMKIVCDKHNWTYNQNDTAKKLIEICFSNDLVPSYLQSQFTALKAVLESGIPTARNKTSGHGQGITQAVVTDYFARYVLNLTATTILFLVEAEKELP